MPQQTVSSTVEDGQLVLFSALGHDGEEIGEVRVEQTLQHITVLFQRRVDAGQPRQ